MTPELDAAWVEWLETEFDNAPKTIRNKHGLLCAAMGAAARQRPTPPIPWNPCAETKLPKCSAREIDHLSEDEYELVEQPLAPFWRTWWEFGVMSMARPGEQGALTVGDIDRHTGGVSITKAWKWANGRMRLGDPKTERGVRMTFVPLETVAQLDFDRPADAYLFLTPSGLPVTSVRFWQQGWAPALARLEALAAGDRTPFTGAAGWEGRSFDELCRRYGHLVGRLTSKRLTPDCTRHTGILGACVTASRSGSYRAMPGTRRSRSPISGTGTSRRPRQRRARRPSRAGCPVIAAESWIWSWRAAVA